MQIINIKIDIKKDAWNWWHACNKVSYGVDWKRRINKKLQTEIAGKTKKEAFVFLIPYLKKIYKKIHIEKKLEEIKKIFIENNSAIFKRMEKVTGRKIYRNDFSIYLTTFPRGPYEYPKGIVGMPIVWLEETYIRTFVHELLHFQTYAYWKKMCLKKLKNKEFEDLKEALTVILNEEFLDIIKWRDNGYKIHQCLREDLLKFWKNNRNFDKLVKYGIKIYPKYRNHIKSK